MFGPYSQGMSLSGAASCIWLFTASLGAKKGGKKGRKPQRERKQEHTWIFFSIAAEAQQERRTHNCLLLWLVTQVCVLQADYSGSKLDSHLPFMIWFPSPLGLEYLSPVFTQLCSSKALRCNSKEIPGGWACTLHTLNSFPWTLRVP